MIKIVGEKGRRLSRTCPSTWDANGEDPARPPDGAPRPAVAKIVRAWVADLRRS
ncbi:hypothetical protein GCM10022254_62190 [Actinomadura meridiana]|uniref:Uncharacterized protein n=1 Tax=Actinomadura meridiana TaxID=559626 RepID=A0ABP8CJ16_9ACTN